MCSMLSKAIKISGGEFMHNISKALIAAGIVALFSLNATAADISPPVIPAASGPGAKAKDKLTFKERIERMRSMTPEQRAKERDLMRQEMRSLPPEQRAEQRKDMRAQFEKMSPEDRRIAREQFREDIDNLSPEERRKEMREHWENMSPEEREQVRKRLQEHWKSLSPEEREARRKEMREHFNNMSPEERRQFKRDMGKLDGMPLPDGDLPGDSDGDTGRPAK
jgi:Spy/CpxP family protein refolding chaperone